MEIKIIMNCLQKALHQCENCDKIRSLNEDRKDFEMKFRILSMLLACLLLALSASACSKKGTDPSDTSVEQPTQDEPSEPKPEDTTDYEAVMRFQFEGLEEASANDFSYEIENGGVKVLSYTGEAEKVRIPAFIESLPVVALGDRAFAGRTDLKVLYVPDGVSYFGKDILKDCTQLYALHTPFPLQENTSFLGYLYGAESYAMNNTAALRALDYLEIGGSMTLLPSYALFDCNDLVVLKLPETVRILGAYSLYRCESLKYVNTENLTDLEAHAMEFCASLEKLSFSQKLQRVGLGALENCTSLRRLTIPFVGESRTQNTFLGYVFGAENYGTAQGFYPTSLENVTVTDGISAIDSHAFYRCQTLQTVSLPTTVKSIGVRAFSGCSSLTAMELPDGLQKIGDAAFSGCEDLEIVIFGAQVSQLGANCFLNCIRLKEIRLPDGLKVLPSSCFSGCKSLMVVSLGGVTTVGKNAFYGCDGLQSVISSQSNVHFEDGNDPAKSLVDP